MRTPPPILPLVLERVSYTADGMANGEMILDTVACRIRQGAPTVILGHNGAGKTVLLRLCHGLLTPTAGRIAWEGGGDPTDAHAMVFQRPVMLRRSAAANIAFALKLRGLNRRDRSRRTAASLAQAGLARLAERPARLMSAGEQQRLALARAAALEPQVLFLDEPTASLDPGAARAIETMIDGLRHAGTKIVLTTHDLGQARRLAGDVIFLHRGRLLEHRPAQEFFAAPASPEARAFVAGELVW